MGDLPTPRDWREVQDLAVGALQANLDFLRRSLPGSPLTTGPQPLTVDHELLICDSTRTGVSWTDQQYFLVPGGQDPQHLPNRLPVELHHFRAQRLSFTVPEATRNALRERDFGPVRLFFVDDTDVQLKTRLLTALRKVTRGPLVHQLWQTDRRAPLALRDAVGGGLNPGQQRAFAAMVSEGASFVWGPPGTGKTKVISAAVADAVSSGRSVLVVSHTHVAVDNVLEKLPDQGFPVGTLVRIAGAGSRDRVSAAVVGRGTLLLDQAAAVLTRHDERLRRLELQEEDVRRARARALAEVTQLNDELSGVDSVSIERAEAAVTAADELPALFARLGRLHDEVARRSQGMQAARDELESLVHRDGVEDGAARDRLAEQRAAARAAASSAQVVVSGLDVQLAGLAEDERPVRQALQLAHAELERTGALGRLLGVEARRARRVTELAERLTDIEVGRLERSRARSGAEAELRAASQRIVATGQALDGLDAAARRQARARVRVADARRGLEEATGARDDLASDVAALRRMAPGAPEARRLLAHVERLGLRAKLVQRDDANARLAHLLERSRELRDERQRVEDEFAAKQRELVRSAPVIACTLTALSTDRLLAQREFDVVILDEVANANASAVVYAAARATRTVALVGDFLQNAPIAETDDPLGDADRASVAWQREDVFALAGITDRATASAHPRCVSLSRQYRYPSIIADIVNEFCYQGQLESERPSRPSDGPTVTFVDAADVEEYELRQDGSSWWSPGGVELMVCLARHHLRGQRPDGPALGFVTPYAPQKRRAEQRARTEGLPVLCGTSHTFQGKEVPVLVFDLMQDRQDRWVGAADLHGGRRAVSAAKLLNVGITRMQQRVYLLGDWRYVRASERPGMRALAAQQGRANFRLLSGRDVLSGVAVLD